ncbi:DUF6924 domain-containing protein [Marinactinospora thermotolerans]|uniref:DUF6924 domain-containing protein n=1 Tax=Marinactinospora thermotolerans TaxID=531310 RepID=UPI003D89B117
MSRSALPLPSADDGPRVPGMLLVRAGHDDEAWQDVLSRMGDLPGLVTPGRARQDHVTASQEPIPRRLLVVDDPAWRGATPDEVRDALGGEGRWVPDLVLLATGGTEADPRLRPLLAFRGTDGDLFWITPRQAALTHLVLHHPYLHLTLEDFEQWAPADPEGEIEGDETAEEEWEAGPSGPVGAYLETRSSPPRYERPTRPLPLLTPDKDGLLVRTDFSDDAAWTSFLSAVRHPAEHDDVIDDFGHYIDIVDDPAFEGATPEQVMASVHHHTDQSSLDTVVIADADAMRGPDHCALIVPLLDRIGWNFRLVPEEVGSLVVNLALSNMDIEDYMDDETRAALW